MLTSAIIFNVFYKLSGTIQRDVYHKDGSDCWQFVLSFSSPDLPACIWQFCNAQHLWTTRNRLVILPWKAKPGHFARISSLFAISLTCFLLRESTEVNLVSLLAIAMQYCVTPFRLNGKYCSYACQWTRETWDS